MADMLKFRKGTYAQINAAPKAAGTIYIARDEKAMYVDIDNATRIRIGDFVRVNTVKDIIPPYSESALYYVESDNALLKYTGAEGGWKQVNGTDDLKTRIEAVEGQASTNKANIATNKTDIGNLKTDVSGLKTTVGGETSGLVKDVADLKAAIGMDEGGTPEGIGSTVAGLVTDLDALELEVHGTDGNGGMKGVQADHTSRIGALETASAQHVTKEEAKAFAKTADIQDTLDKVDTEGTVSAAISAAVAVEKNRAEGAEQTLTNNLAAVKNTADAALSKAAFESFKTENTDAISTAKSEAISGATATAKSYTDDEITKEVNRANGAYAPKSLVETVAGHTGTLTTLTGNASTVGSVEWAKAAADAAMAKANEKTTMAEVEAKNYATKTEAKGYADAKDAAIKAAKDAADAAQGAADAAQGAADDAQADATAALTAIGDASSGLTKIVNSHTAALEILNGADSVNGSVANAKKAGTDAGAQAETNRQNIASLKGTVDKLDGDVNTTGSVKKQIKDATDALKTVLSAEIDADIRAANAMEYAGTINSASGIPATGVKNGATYVIGTSFDSYAAGDMLIAQGTEDPDTGLITNPTWAHVKSGYDASLDQQLTGANNKIMLSNGVRNDEDAAGAITFAATGSASVEVKNNTVTIGMVWEDFE